MQNLQIRLAGTADIPLIAKVAAETWGPTYLPFISPEQVEFMFGEMYTPSALEKQMTVLNHTFILLFEGKNAVAFASFAPRPENLEICKIHKLYITPSCQKKGYGKLLLDALSEQVMHACHSSIELNVNRRNPAVGFYLRVGFTIAREEDIPIGNFWMNDYVMRKELAS